MVHVTVFLVRCGTTQYEAFEKAIRGDDDDDDDDDNNNNDNDDILELADSDDEDNMSNGHNRSLNLSGRDDDNDSDRAPHSPAFGRGRLPKRSTPRLRHSERVDPYLAFIGYQQAQYTLTSLLQGISDSTEQERRIAAFTAPTKACVGTAMMLSCAGLNKYTNMRWQLSTAKCLQAPCAVPVIVHNPLCTSEAEIERCGGYRPVVDAGLLHCAAEAWNDARQKCPMSHVVKLMKSDVKHHVREWKDEAHVDADERRRVLDVQFMRIEHGNDPWSLRDMTLKNNILIDLIDPTKYMTPPRKGTLAPKRQGKIIRPGPEVAIQEGVWWARQVGCDTAIFMVGQAAMQELARATGLLGEGDELEVPPCSLASLIANVPDGAEYKDVEFEFHGFYTLDDLLDDPFAVVPAYTGPVDVLIPPPKDNDPMTVPVNQWSKFKPPQPENIPFDYPDLPPFSESLTAPLPKRPQGRRGTVTLPRQ